MTEFISRVSPSNSLHSFEDPKHTEMLSFISIVGRASVKLVLRLCGGAGRVAERVDSVGWNMVHPQRQ